MPIRGCGSRVKGACYIETFMGKSGVPFNDFLIDPPIPIEPQDFGITPLGVKIFERNGVYHVIDWVGSSFYPYVADFIEEVKKLGLSRRIPASLNFKKLTNQSMIFLVHANAFIENSNKYPEVPCPKNIEHDKGEMCIGKCWHDIDPEDIDNNVRVMPEFSYPAAVRPNVGKYRPAIFLGLPIHRIAVIKDDDGLLHQKALEKIGEIALPVSLENE